MVAGTAFSRVQEQRSSRFHNPRKSRPLCSARILILKGSSSYYMLSLHAGKVKDKMFKAENPVWRQIIQRAGVALPDGQHMDVTGALLVLKVRRLLSTASSFLQHQICPLPSRELVNHFIVILHLFCVSFGCNIREFLIKVWNCRVFWSVKRILRSSFVWQYYTLRTFFFHHS